MPEIRKLNLRLPPDLHAQMVDLAQYECISLNALTVAALRNWISYRNRSRPGLSTTKSPKQEVIQRPKDVYAPCPCGSGKKWRFCHGAAA